MTKNYQADRDQIMTNKKLMKADDVSPAKQMDDIAEPFDRRETMLQASANYETGFGRQAEECLEPKIYRGVSLPEINGGDDFPK